MVLALRKFHRILYFTAVLFFFIPCYPVLWFMSSHPDRYYRQLVFLRKWISVISVHAVGIRFDVEFEQEIDWSRPYILCPNHTSMLDITALTYLCPQPFSFIGKIELLKNPVTRIFFQSIDIPVNRTSRISAFKAFKRGQELLTSGRSVVIFPEGKIDDEYPPRLHEFKPGAFRMACETNTPILPVVIHNAWEVMWDNGGCYGSKPGCIRISVLSPIEMPAATHAGGSNIGQLVFQRMHEVWRLRYRCNCLNSSAPSGDSEKIKN